jgi:hypothetical protein
VIGVFLEDLVYNVLDLFETGGDAGFIWVEQTGERFVE